MITTIKVEGMHCQHCAAAITKAVFDLDGVEKVGIDLTNKLVEIQHDGTSKIEEMEAAIVEQGYEVVQ